VTRQENESADSRPLLDEVALLAELDRLELRGISRPKAAATTPRDANRWNLCPLPGADPEARVEPEAVNRRAWLPIVVGLCAGAAASAALFHERLASIWNAFRPGDATYTFVLRCRTMRLECLHPSRNRMHARAAPPTAARHESGKRYRRTMDVPADFPSLMDDAEFLAELEKVEGAAPARAADRASRVALATGFDIAPCPTASPSTRTLAMTDAAPAALVQSVVGRDVNRWNAQSDLKARQSAAAGSDSRFAALVAITIGVSAGALGSALMFHDRVAWLLRLWSR
jgi:hypothetical protein